MRTTMQYWVQRRVSVGCCPVGGAYRDLVCADQVRDVGHVAAGRTHIGSMLSEAGRANQPKLMVLAHDLSAVP